MINAVQIDDIILKNSDKKSTLYLISHDHKDVATPKSVPIHTSNIVANILARDNIIGTFIYSELPRTYVIHNITVYVFATEHSYGSVGYFVPRVGVLFMGDGRITSRVMSCITEIRDQVRICYIDTLFDEHDFMSIESSLGLLRTLIEACRTHEVCVEVSHSSVLKYLSAEYLCRSHDVPKLELYKSMSTIPKPTTTVSVARKCDADALTIRLCARIFFLEQSGPVVLTSTGFRVFIAFHASRSENDRLRQYLEPTVEFRPVDHSKKLFLL